jgi:hypothetical protein
MLLQLGKPSLTCRAARRGYSVVLSSSSSAGHSAATTGSTSSGLFSAATAAADAAVGDAVILGRAGSDCSISSSC